MKKFATIEKYMCKELDDIERKLENGSDLSMTDIEKADTLAHALKSLATYEAMKEADEYDGFSGRAPREGGGRSYSDGYSQGYYDAHSGHYPYMPMQRGGRGW